MNQAQKIGMSAAASWAWGTSLIVGMQIAQDMGLVVWLIWATANTLTLSFFGELMRRGILGRHVFDLPAIKWLALLIQVFCLIIQLNIINDVLLDLEVSPTLSYWLASGIGILFVVAMHEIANKTVGTIIALLICVSWGVCCDLGIIELWSKIGVYRVGFALLILVLGIQAYRYEGAKRRNVNSKRTK